MTATTTKTAVAASLMMAMASFLGGACVAGQPGEEPLVGTESQAIVNGEVSTTDAPVVALVYRGIQFCSGTVIGKRTVLTAAHCLPPHVDVPMFGIDVFFGTDVASQDGANIKVVDALANPSWNINTVAGDVGVIALASDAPVEAVPMAYLDISETGSLGHQARAVGYGLTEADGSGNGTRRTGMVTIDRFDASSIYLKPQPSAPCNGDSGGALFIEQDGIEVLAGINSRSDCGSAIIAERVDVHTMDFIVPFMEEHEGAASCGLDGMCASNCDEPDPDCPCAADGLCDEAACLHPSADLDCSSECPVDGVCDASCSYDYDCTLGDEAATCPEGDSSCEDPAGCSAGGSSSSLPLAFGFLFLLAGRRRRRDA